MGRIEESYFKGTEILKPREHAAFDGIGSLSDAELVALLLNTGNKKENVVALSERFLREKGGMRNIFLNDIPLETKGVKSGKIYRLLAVREIMKRLPLSVFDKIENKETLLEKTRYYFLGKKKELALILYLDYKKRLVLRETFDSDSYNQVTIPIEKVIRKSIFCEAKFVIMMHNHPSENVTPSQEDIRFAFSLGEQLNLISVLLLDSLIVGENQNYSMRENKIGPFATSC